MSQYLVIFFSFFDNHILNRYEFWQTHFSYGVLGVKLKFLYFCIFSIMKYESKPCFKVIILSWCSIWETYSSSTFCLNIRGIYIRNIFQRKTVQLSTNHVCEWMFPGSAGFIQHDSFTNVNVRFVTIRKSTEIIWLCFKNTFQINKDKGIQQRNLMPFLVYEFQSFLR